MNELAWAWLTLRRGRVFSLVSLLITMLLVAIAATALIMSRTINKQIMADYVSSGSLGQVKVDAPIDNGAKLLTAQSLKFIRQLPGVTKISPVLHGSATLDAESVLLHIQNWPHVGQVKLIAGRAPKALNELVLPESFANAAGGASLLKKYLNQQVKVAITNRVGENAGVTKATKMLVVGVYAAKTVTEFPDTAFLTFGATSKIVAAREGLTAKAMLASKGVTQVLVQTSSIATARNVAGKLSRKGFDSRAIADTVADLSGAPGLIKIMAMITAALLGFVMAMGAFSRALDVGKTRLQEFALLRGLGWQRGKLLKLVVLENVLALVVILGLSFLVSLLVARLFSGKVLGLLNLANGSLAIPWSWLAVFFTGLLVVTLVASWFGVMKSLRKDPYLVARGN